MKKHFFLGSGIILVLMAISGCGKTTSTPSDTAAGSVTSNTAPQVVAVPKVERFPNDLDRDGIDNETEKQLGLSETEFDSDGDGLSDLQEINTFKTDPKKIDSDGDGYTDADEIINGYNPNGSGKIPKQ